MKFTAHTRKRQNKLKVLGDERNLNVPDNLQITDLYKFRYKNKRKEALEYYKQFPLG